MGRSDNIRVRVGGIIIKDSKILLIAHKKNSIITWLVPGGGVDYGESLSQALIREFKEELNIKISVNQPKIICDSLNPNGERHIVNIYFSCNYIEGEYVLDDEERLYDFGFFSSEEILCMSIHPPINNELINLIEGREHDIYLGSLWK